MTPERWQQIDQLFHAVLEREQQERAAFVDQVCAGDELLRRELSSLLASHEQSDSFIEFPAADIAADLLARTERKFENGEFIDHYKVIKLLARGGMGDVYLAEDTSLGRPVALKLLPAQFTANPDRVQRFAREARAASALNHPNIVTIHEIGRTDEARFIVTEFVDGQTLRDWLTDHDVSLEQALGMTIQIAGALQAAHSAGIIHRDIKPENIMVRSDGYLKVLDFGLAKLTEGTALQIRPDESEMEGDRGKMMGTVRYMSPEQTRGEDVDARSDIWSMGVVFYELVTLHMPFSGDTRACVINSILHEQPVPLSHYAEVPVEAERIVSKALNKQKEARYQTVSEFACDLEVLKEDVQLNSKLDQANRHENGKEIVGKPGRLGFRLLRSQNKYHSIELFLGAAALLIALAAIPYLLRIHAKIKIDSIAILPFASNDPKLEYVADGISEILTDELSQVPNLRVISFSSSLRYKGKQVDPQTVGHQLNVQGLVTGTLTQVGDAVVLRAKLVDLHDKHEVWSNEYRFSISDLQGLQTAMSREISDQLRVQLTGQERQRLPKRTTIDAYQLYVLASYYNHQQTKEGWEKALEYLNEVVKLDPSFAPGYEELALVNSNLGLRGYLPPKEAHERIAWAASKALELDDTLAMAHSLLAYEKETNWDWAGAEKEFVRAIELNPNSSFVIRLYATYLIDVGRSAEAITCVRHAEELDPLSNGAYLAFAYLGDRQYGRAIEEFHKAIEKTPNDPQLHFFLGETSLYDRDYEQGIAELQKAVAIENAPERWDRQPMLGYAYAVSGRRNEALKILAEEEDLAKQRYISAFNFAILYTGLGDKDRAFEWLEKSYAQHSHALDHLKTRPMFDSLRSDPRYNGLLRRMRFPS